MADIKIDVENAWITITRVNKDITTGGDSLIATLNNGINLIIEKWTGPACETNINDLITMHSTVKNNIEQAKIITYDVAKRIAKAREDEINMGANKESLNVNSIDTSTYQEFTGKPNANAPYEYSESAFNDVIGSIKNMKETFDQYTSSLKKTQVELFDLFENGYNVEAAKENWETIVSYCENVKTDVIEVVEQNFKNLNEYQARNI